MSEERALPDLISKIRIDSTGVDAALGSLIGGLGRAQLAMVGLGAALGLLVIGGKSMLDIAMKEDAAHRSLAQAVDVYNSSLGKNTKSHEVWVATASKANITAKQLAAAHVAVSVATQAEDVAQAAYTRALYTYGPQSASTMKAEIALENAKQRLAMAQQAVNVSVGQSTGKWVTVAGTQARARISLEDYQKSIEAFIETNKKYISDQAEVTDGFAHLIRSGLSTTEVQLDMNRAVDLAAIKHVSLSDAVNLVDNAEHGRLRGLIDLGITSSKYVDSAGNIIDANHNMAKVMAELDQRTAHGRNTLTDYQQKWNLLNNDWQNLSKKGGPVIETLLDTIVTKLSDAYDALDKFGKDNTAWAGISSHLVGIAQAIHDNLLFPLQAVWDAYTGQTLPPSPISSKNPPQSVGNEAGNSGSKNPAGGYNYNTPKASGGPVLPNRVYTVGENDVETLVMGARGGYVIPGGTGGRSGGGKSLTVVVNVAGSVQTERSMNMAIREGIRRLDREYR